MSVRIVARCHRVWNGHYRLAAEQPTVIIPENRTEWQVKGDNLMPPVKPVRRQRLDLRNNMRRLPRTTRLTDNVATKSTWPQANSQTRCGDSGNCGVIMSYFTFLGVTGTCASDGYGDEWFISLESISTRRQHGLRRLEKRTGSHIRHRSPCRPPRLIPDNLRLFRGALAYASSGHG